MFYKIIKNFFLKKNVVKKLTTKKLEISNDKIKTIGIIVDESFFKDTERVVEKIISHGFKRESIFILVYQDKLKNKFQLNEPFLALHNISISGKILKNEVIDFINTPFDLLLNYYDLNKSALLLLSVDSKAKFKVGFETVDNRVNHLIIKSHVENFSEFTLELFKYLKILNKI